MRNIAAIALVILLGSSGAHAQSAKESAETGNRQFMTAFANGDGAAIGALYTSDAALLPPGEDRIDGREAIGAYWQNAVDAGFKDLRLETAEVIDGGDTAAEVGHWSIAAPDGKGGSATVGGKYIVVWKRAEGGWQLYRDIWNDDPPAASK
jgi:uncharacterized protein (TIGR02246 family)